jgi:hypothetical protein
MKGVLAFMSNLMLFLTLATLVAACASFFAHKLRQRAKPASQKMARQSQRDAPSMVQAYDPKASQTSQTKESRK